MSKLKKRIKIEQKKIEDELKSCGVYNDLTLRKLICERMLNGSSVKEAIEQLLRSLDYIKPSIKTINKKLLEGILDE